MILKKEVNGDYINVMYNSSNILTSVYHKPSKDLTLVFKAGTPYIYENVEYADYYRFEIAESQGKVFNSTIKTHPFRKLEKIDVTSILTEAETLKAKLPPNE